LTERKPSEPNPDEEIPYLLCRLCGSPTYVFEVESGRISEAICVTCGNEAVTEFTIAEWDDVPG
jgi:hypothetical protein